MPHHRTVMCRMPHPSDLAKARSRYPASPPRKKFCGERMEWRHPFAHPTKHAHEQTTCLRWAFGPALNRVLGHQWWDPPKTVDGELA
jgi:hypothetical protein